MRASTLVCVDDVELATLYRDDYRRVMAALSAKWGPYEVPVSLLISCAPALCFADAWLPCAQAMKAELKLEPNDRSEAGLDLLCTLLRPTKLFQMLSVG